jgi:hypothetical protein
LWTIITDVEKGLDDDFYLYPNPSTGAFRIIGLENIKNVELRDMTGRKIDVLYGYEEATNFVCGARYFTWDHVVKIETADAVYYRKILIY